MSTPPTGTDRRRRQWLMGGLGLAALLSGWWLGRSPPKQETTNTEALLTQDKQLSEAFWALSFPGPDGSSVPLRNARGQHLVINFWATWCPPCVHEMPELDAFQASHADQGWRVLGLAVDNEAAVRDFLAKKPVGFSIGIAGFEGTRLSSLLGNASGGLPFTVVIDRQGVVKERITGATSEQHLRDLAAKMG